MGFCKVPSEDAGCQQWLRWGAHHRDEWTLSLGLQPAIQLIPPRHGVQTSLCWDTSVRAKEAIEIEEKLLLSRPTKLSYLQVPSLKGVCKWVLICPQMKGNLCYHLWIQDLNTILRYSPLFLLMANSIDSQTTFPRWNLFGHLRNQPSFCF